MQQIPDFTAVGIHMDVFGNHLMASMPLRTIILHAIFVTTLTFAISVRLLCEKHYTRHPQEAGKTTEILGWRYENDDSPSDVHLIQKSKCLRQLKFVVNDR